MENNIGVGLVVGLTLASSIYVWNNSKFSGVQKTILLICIVFPPAQWLGILVVLAYNSSVENNTPERRTEKKLYSTLSSLTELKEKGILTEEEYKTKVAKIDAEKTEKNLKNSLEYKQLKSLFDSGVLTKDEFESKVEILSKKKTDNKKIENVIGTTDKKEENIFKMYNYLVFRLLAIIILLLVFKDSIKPILEGFLDWCSQY